MGGKHGRPSVGREGSPGTGQALQVGAYTVSEKSVTENGVSILNNFKRPVSLVSEFSLALYILY